MSKLKTMNTILLKESDLTGTIFEQHFVELERLSQKSQRTLDYILNVICIKHNVTPEEVKSQSKQGNIIEARFAFMFIAHEIDLINAFRRKNTLAGVGRFINRDHGTVIHGIKKVTYYCEDLRYRKDLENCISCIFGDEGIKTFENYIKKNI